MSVTNLYTYRGEIRGLASVGGTLAFVTVHDEGQSTALYRIDVEKRKMAISALPCGGQALALSDDAQLYVAGTDGKIYHRALEGDDFSVLAADLPSPAVALTVVSGGRLAAICGDALLIIAGAKAGARKAGKVLQSLPLAEPGASIACDPSGAWLAVGGARGLLSIFDGETAADFVAAESAQVHQGPVMTLLFERGDLRVLSGGTDAKIFLTHVRGKLEPELRSGASGHQEAVTSLVHGPGERSYSGGRDGVVKTWTRGQGRSSTLKNQRSIRALAMIEYKGRPHLAIAGDDESVRLYAVDASGKIGDLAITVVGAAAWARNERGEKDPKAREKSLKKIAGWNDAIAIDHLGWSAANDSDHALKALATELLGASGNPRARKPLESLLRASEEAVRLEALVGLRSLEGESSLSPLRLALQSRHADVGLVAVQALTALAKKGDDIARDRLVEALGDDPNEVRSASLLALETLHDAKSPEAELLGLRSSKSDLRRLALLRCWQRSLVSRPEILAALRRAAADTDAGVRATAFQISILAQPKLAAALRYRDAQLHRQLHEIESATAPSFEVEVESTIKKWAKRAMASVLSAIAGGEGGGKAKKLAKAKKVAASTVSEEDKRPLLEAMASRALDTCLSGSKGLALLGDPRALGTLLQLSRERDGNVRVEVCKSLQALGDSRASARLRLLLRDGEASVRDAAYSALIKLETATPLAIAEAGLLAEHEDVRRRGLDLLVKGLRADHKAGKEGEAGAIALLERALGDAGRSVRSEAFKAVLNLDVDGGAGASLRFALRSPHADIRREVLGEVIGQIEQGWAWELLLELFADPDPGVRAEAFEFAMKRTRGVGEEPLRAALSGPYPDLRLAATEILSKRKAPGVEELLATATRDDDAEVRRMAIDALLVNEADGALVAAMTSPHADVVVRAAAARATHGDPRALSALLNVLAEEEPEETVAQRAWVGRVIAALEGLAELGEPGAKAKLTPFLESKDATIRKAAILALSGCTRPGDAEGLAQLQAALAHADAAVRQGAALGLALCGELSGASILFSAKSAGVDALHAALALGDRAHDIFMSFLDHRSDAIRRRSMLLLLLQELAEGDGVPDRSLAALSAANPRVRLAAAEALENFADHEEFFKFVVRQVNDRGEGKAAWTISAHTIGLLAEAITFGDESGNPQFKVRAARLLDTLGEEKQEAFDRQWRIFTERFGRAVGAIEGRSAERPQAPSVYAPEELRALVFGAYAGLSRLSGGSAEARIRQTSIARLVAVAREGWAPSRAVFSVLVPALGDGQASVRTLAFESLRDLGMSASELATEAIGAGQRDVGGLGLDLLARSGGDEGGASVLEQVIRENTDGLEQEAARLLAVFRAGVSGDGTLSDADKAKLDAAWIAVHRLALGGRSESLRGEAVRGLAGAYEAGGVGPAADGLRAALGSKYYPVRLAAAEALAERNDPACFDVLVEVLAREPANDQRAAIRSLHRLGDPRAAGAFLDRIDDDPSGTARVADLLKAAGALRLEASADRLLGYLQADDRRDAAFSALLTVSGYDQKIEDPEDEGKRGSPGWEAKQHPRRDGILVRLMGALRHLGDDGNLSRLFPAATWARGGELDGALVPLLSHAKPNLRNGAISALSWRLRRRGADPAPLVAALSGNDPNSLFLAAEGLALAGHAEGISTLLAGVEMMPELAMRKRAVLALGHLADVRALDLLLRLASEEGHALQEQAAEALGHLREAAPDRADKVFAVLKSLAKGTMTGVARQALTGLRYFGGRDAWALIRDAAAADSWQLRERAAELLQHDSAEETRELLGTLLRSDRHRRVIKAAGTSLRLIFGEDSVEPDYAFLEGQRALELQPDLIERLRERGDPQRILELLPKVQTKELLPSLVAILTARSPLPIEAAVTSLRGSDRGLTVAVAARILGTAGEALGEAESAELVRAGERWAKSWAAEMAKVSGTATLSMPTDDDDDGVEPGHVANFGVDTGKLAELEAPYLWLIWGCAQVGVGDALLIQASCAGGDDRRGQAIRRAGVIGLAGGDGELSEAARENLKALACGGDAELRALAAAALSGRDRSAASALVGSLLDDGVSVARLLDGEVGDAAKGSLMEAAGDAHRQGVALPYLVSLGDAEGLGARLRDRTLNEALRLGIVEALARIADPGALDLLRAFGRDEEEDEELRKAAWRAVRRGQRRQDAASKPPRRSRWEVQP